MSDCKGNIYIVNGKRWCVGEKKVSKKWGTKKSTKTTKKSKTTKTTKKVRKRNTKN
jgi:hypothetical protein